MERPIIFSIDDDPQVLRAISRDLRTMYGKEFKILSTTSANEALESLTDLKNSSDVVALFVCDQRMPETSPRRWPVKSMSCSAGPKGKPMSPVAVQNIAISSSVRARSREFSLDGARMPMIGWENQVFTSREILQDVASASG